MAKCYDLYGSRALSSEQLRDALATLLELEFVARTSDFIGDYYLSGFLTDEEFSIQHNATGFEDDIYEPDFEDYPEIIEVTARSEERANEIRDCLAAVDGLEFLRRKQV